MGCAPTYFERRIDLEHALTYISLFTDFGDADGYVGALKGVIAGIAPDVPVIDVGHGSPPGDLLSGAFTWTSALEAFPPDGIHVAVIDPGVGTERRAVAVAAGDSLFVAPDNGLLSGFLAWHDSEPPPRPFARWAASEERVAVTITNTAYLRAPMSATFHGRDIFAPAAAHLAAGVALQQLGPSVALASLSRLTTLFPVREGHMLMGTVAAVDRFGNLRTNIPYAWLPSQPVIRLYEHLNTGVPVVTVSIMADTFADGPRNLPFGYAGSAGTLEVAVWGDSASSRLQIGVGSKVVIETSTARVSKTT